MKDMISSYDVNTMYIYIYIYFTKIFNFLITFILTLECCQGVNDKSFHFNIFM